MTIPQLGRHECTIDGRLVRLAPIETKLLSTLLVSSPDRFAERPELIEAVWPDPDTQPLDAVRSLSHVLHMLRRLGVPIQSRTARGGNHVGYRILTTDRG